MSCLLLQLIPVITASGNRTSKQERVQLLKSVLRLHREMYKTLPWRNGDLFEWLSAFKTSSVELFTQAFADSSVLPRVSDDI
jgi:hypothetical protein